MFGPVLENLKNELGLSPDEKVLSEFSRIAGMMNIETSADVRILRERVARRLGISVEKLENEKYMAFNASQIPTKQMTFWFISSDIERVEKAIEDAASTLIKGDSTHVVAHENYAKIVDLIIKVKKMKNVKNSAIAFQEILAAAEKHFAQANNADAV